MHPLTTYDLHRREQVDALRRLDLVRRRELASPDDHATGRPPDPRRTVVHATATSALWVPTLGHMAP